MPFDPGKVKAAIQDLRAEGETIRHRARHQEPPLYSWLARASLVAKMLGSKGQLFASEIDSARNVDNYRERLFDWNKQVRGTPLPINVISEWIVDGVAGILEGIDRSIEAGLLTDIEDQVASAIYSDVLSEASILLKANHLSCAAILVRVGLESGLRRIAHQEGMADYNAAKASVINDWLWKNQTYPKATHDGVSGWLAPGNAFAHDRAEKDKYTHADIAKALEDVRSFLARMLV